MDGLYNTNEAFFYDIDTINYNGEPMGGGGQHLLHNTQYIYLGYIRESDGYKGGGEARR